jgi:hypothetical protein
MKRGQPADVIDEVFAFDGVAVAAAKMRARLATAETGLGLADLLAATTARQADATFLTADVSDFDKPVHDGLPVDVVRWLTQLRVQHRIAARIGSRNCRPGFLHCGLSVR